MTSYINIRNNVIMKLCVSWVISMSKSIIRTIKRLKKGRLGIGAVMNAQKLK